MYLAFRNISNLNTIILERLSILPKDIDLVVGIPRSGMLPANLIALYLHRPYTDIDSFCEGRIYSSGERGSFINKQNTKKVLVVDDSISSGKALVKAKGKLKGLESEYKIEYACIYASTEGCKKVDYWFEIIDGARIFQWNLFNYKNYINHSCFDIDGVLCENPPMDDDGPVYLDYIQHAIPKYIPSVEIDTLVSCRLEKYRAFTEKWLADNHVKYKKLVMLDMASKEERQKWGKHGIYKGEIYRDGDYKLFVESSLHEAKDIFKVSHKPVFCTETMEMISEKTFAESMHQTARTVMGNSMLYKGVKHVAHFLKDNWPKIFVIIVTYNGGGDKCLYIICFETECPRRYTRCG